MYMVPLASLLITSCNGRDEAEEQRLEISEGSAAAVPSISSGYVIERQRQSGALRRAPSMIENPLPFFAIRCLCVVALQD